MKRFGQALRLLQINAVFIRHGLDEILLAAPPLRRLRFLFYLLPWNWVRGRPREGRSVRIRRALEDLGPIFVKFGQILSTRRDLLPEDIGDELAGLQDRVPPFPGSLARRMIEHSLGRSVDELFASFDEEPLASASIAQVHTASLRDGREVAVKVVRPGIEAEVRRDVGVLYWLAELAERYLPLGRRLKPVDVVAEYESTILDELDLMREAASASQLRRNFENSDLLHVPRVYWRYTRSDVMVMERISGIPVSDVDRLVRHGIDLENLAVRGVEIFFTQLMRDNFFHADMHPRQHLRVAGGPRASELRRGRFRNHGQPHPTGPTLSGGEPAGLLQPRLPASGGTCMCSRDGCRPGPGSTSSRPRFAASASRYSRAP